MARDADQLLRMMANPAMFRRSEEEKSRSGGRQGTRDSITTLVSGMFRITGSVAVSDINEDRRDDDLSGQKDNSEHGDKRPNIVGMKRSVSLPHCANTWQNQRVKKISAPPIYSLNTSQGGNKPGFQTKSKKIPSFAGCYTLPDIMEDQTEHIK